MSDFFKRWSARKREALQPASPQQEVPQAAPTSEEIGDTNPVHIGIVGEVDADTHGVATPPSADPVPVSPLDAASAQGAKTPAKSALPDKETLRAMFRSHKPDGLDDYTQDFSQPELLPAALTVGLRNWLVESVLPAEDKLAAVVATQGEDEADAAPVAPAPVIAGEAIAENPAIVRDILVITDGQNVPFGDEPVARSGS